MGLEKFIYDSSKKIFRVYSAFYNIFFHGGYGCRGFFTDSVNS